MRNVKRRKKTKEPLDVDITSLLDILTILLVFLLKSFNASELEVDLMDKIKIPDSASRTFGHQGIQLQVNDKKEIWMNSIKLGRIPNSEPEVDFLFEALKQEKEKIKEKGQEELDSTEMVNIVMDETTKYETMRQIMHTSALAGFPRFKFIVQGNYE